MWVQVSGCVIGDSNYLALLARMGWVSQQQREEERLCKFHGERHLQAVLDRLKDLGYPPRWVRPRRGFYGREGYGHHG